MILSGGEIIERVEKRELILNADPVQMERMEGGVYDLRIDKLFRFGLDRYSHIGIEGRETPNVFEEEGGGWMIRGYQLISTIEELIIPANIRVRIFRKTTLFRCGLDLLFGEVDPGYYGTLTFGLVNLLGGEAIIEKGARICSIAFEELSSEETFLYNGVWQGGKVSTFGKKERAY